MDGIKLESKGCQGAMGLLARSFSRWLFHWDFRFIALALAWGYSRIVFSRIVDKSTALGDHQIQLNLMEQGFVYPAILSVIVMTCRGSSSHVIFLSRRASLPLKSILEHYLE